MRLALGACAKTLTGKPAAGSTQRRKRSVFYNALGCAVELGRLSSNPIDRIQWTAPAVAQTVDRRVVVSPAQARKLLAAVRGLSDRGAHLEAFYGCLYYAALRPSEAVMLRESDLYLPKTGWGRIVLAASAPRAGTAWTDHGTSRQERGLKHRADNETRTIPIPPELVRLLRAHIKRYGTTPDGRIFQTARGGITQDSAYSAVWAEARQAALSIGPSNWQSPRGATGKPPARGVCTARSMNSSAKTGRSQRQGWRTGQTARSSYLNRISLRPLTSHGETRRRVAPRKATVGDR